MTELKWYEELTLSVMFIPFRWRLQCMIQAEWGSAHIWIGPLFIGIGFPMKNT